MVCNHVTKELGRTTKKTFFFLQNLHEKELSFQWRAKVLFLSTKLAAVLSAARQQCFCSCLISDYFWFFVVFHFNESEEFDSSLTPKHVHNTIYYNITSLLKRYLPVISVCNVDIHIIRRF